MTDFDHIHDALAVVDAIDYPIVSNTDTPQVLVALDLTGSEWPRLVSEVLDFGKDAS